MRLWGAVALVMAGCSSPSIPVDAGAGSASVLAVPDSGCAVVPGSPGCRSDKTFEYICGPPPDKDASHSASMPRSDQCKVNVTTQPLTSCCQNCLTTQVPGCGDDAGDWTGYVCSANSKPPPQAPLVPCFARSPDDAGYPQYCCTHGLLPSTGCFHDPGDVICSGTITSMGPVAVVCASSAPPASTTYSCDAGPPANVGTAFCCSGPVGTCAADPGVKGCGTGSSGYTCTGVRGPDFQDSTIACSVGIVADDGTTHYCCRPWAAGACVPQPVPYCIGPRMLGFACGNDTAKPSDADPSLTCSLVMTSIYTAGPVFCCQN